jgi:hypothetical protein
MEHRGQKASLKKGKKSKEVEPKQPMTWTGFLERLDEILDRKLKEV